MSFALWVRGEAQAPLEDVLFIGLGECRNPEPTHSPVGKRNAVNNLGIVMSRNCGVNQTLPELAIVVGQRDATLGPIANRTVRVSWYPSHV